MPRLHLCCIRHISGAAPLRQNVRRLRHSSVSPTTDAYTGCSLHPRRADSSSGASGRASSYSARECRPVFSLCFYPGVVCASRFVLAGDSSVRRHDGLDGHHNGCHLGDTAMVCPVSLAASALFGLSAACRAHPAVSIATHHWPFYRGGVGWWRGLLVPPAYSTRPASPRCCNRARALGRRDNITLRAGRVSK